MSTADDPRAEPRAQPKTTELPAVPQWAAELVIGVKALNASVTERFDSVDKRLTELAGSDKTLTDQMTDLDTEFRDMRTRQRSAEDDIRRLSMRTKDTNVNASKQDLEQAAQLAQEREAREALATKVDALTATQETQLAILTRLDKIASNPLVKTIVTILGTALATWAASKGLK